MQVKRQVLPALLKLTNDAELGVKALAIEALAKLWQLFSNSSSSLEKLHRHLDTIMSCGVHEVTAHPPYDLTTAGKLMAPTLVAVVACESLL